MNWLQNERVDHILKTVLDHVALLAKRDLKDHVLDLFWPFADRFLGMADAETLHSYAFLLLPFLNDADKSSSTLNNQVR